MSQENLINLSLDEELPVKRKESLEYNNNPFDLLEKESIAELDPFEMCMKQVSAMNSTPATSNTNVQTEKLLCFSGENSMYESPALIPFTDSIDKMDTFAGIAAAASSSGCDTPTNITGNKKKVDHRKRLLKMSLTNSGITTSSLEGTPSPVLFDGPFLNDSLGYRSPKSSFEDSFMDINSIKPDWLDAENSMDAELAALCIPALKEPIPSPLAELEEPSANDSLKEKFEKFRDRMNSSETKTTPRKEENKKQSPVLELLRERVKLFKEQELKDQSKKEASPETSKSSSFDVSSLISSLKNIALECSTEQKKNIVDSLTSIFKDKDEKPETNPEPEKKDDTLMPPPQPIVRQGTFDIELDESREKSNAEAEQEELLNQSPPQASLINDEDQNEVDINECKTPEFVQPEFNNIVEQIGKLLGNQNVNVVQANIQTPCQGNQQTMNPTYIVVMNTPLQTPSNLQRSIMNAGNFNDGSPELNQSAQMRKRSQSLSTHDKQMLAQKDSENSQKVYSATPQRLPGFRRNSISSSNFTPIRRPSFSGNKDPILTQTHIKKPSFDEPAQNTKPLANIRPELNGRKLKLKATSDLAAKQSGPLKATIPIKKVAPMIVNPQQRQPMTMTSTPRDNNGPKSRYSYMPNSASASKNTLSPGGATRRRTVSEKSSPKKVDGGVTKSAARSLKMPQSIGKALNKFGVPKAGAPRPKNKENKNPGL